MSFVSGTNLNHILCGDTFIYIFKDCMIKFACLCAYFKKKKHLFFGSKSKLNLLIISKVKIKDSD